MNALTVWLRKVADSVDQQLLDEVFGYESGTDGEIACCHTAKEIERGKCRAGQPDEVTAVRLIGSRYADRPGYDSEWRPR